ncbi:MAG: major capsid protein [Dehalococcoidia bacterium]
MALTLAESAKLTNDVLLRGVIETILKESPILQVTPFIEIEGNGLTYNREKALAAAKWFPPLGTWDQPTAPEFDPLTATLSILGRDADLDNFIRQTRSNIQDIEAAVLELAAKSLRHEFERTLVYGTTATYLTGQTVDANAFDGLVKLIATGGPSDQVVTMGGTGGTLTFSKVDHLIDAVKGGKPDILMMSRRSRRKMNELARAAGFAIETDRDQWGNFIQLWNGIPVAINDWILDTHVLTSGYETAVTGGTCSTIYALRFGEGAVCGATNQGIQIERVGTLETKDATRHRLKWYCSLVDFNVVARAALIGVTD